LSSDWAHREHIKIPSNEIDRDRKPIKRFKIEHETSEDNFSENGERLKRELEETVSYAKREKKAVEGENVFLVLTTAKPISKEHLLLKKYFTFSLQTGDVSAIVSADDPNLSNLREDIKAYARANDQKTYVSQIKRIARVRINKISEELIVWSKRSNKPDDIEISLLPNMGKDYYERILQKLKVFLENANSPIIDTFVDERVASIRATMTPEIMFSVVESVDSIWKAKKVPEIVTEEPQGLELKRLPELHLIPEGLKPICVLDTGIEATHPLLRGLIDDAYDFTQDSDTSDFKGHGTFVAGLAAYGNLDNLANRRSIEPSAKIINAKVQSRLKRYNKNFLESRVESAVQRFHDKTNIFSLSVMYPHFYDYTQHPSDLAYKLDMLSHDYNVIFVISSGNLPDKVLNPLLSSHDYPDYFSEDCCLHYYGAESCNSIAVGGIAHKDNSRAAAKEGQPSPFTRRGANCQRAKPDVVHNAGNIEFDGTTRAIGSNNEELGVVSLGIGRHPIAYSLGTSFSTPVVANILSKLQKKFPNASLNLLKALVIHSARYPDGHTGLNLSPNMKKLLYGKGKPNFESAAFSQNHSVTYLVEDSLRCDEIASIPFYVPQMMKDIWNRRIRITLTYDPPVNVGVDGYTLVDLDFKLFKQVSENHFIEQRQHWNNDFRIMWDNVKSDAFTWQKSGWGTDWRVEISPEIRFRNEFEGTRHVQNYALIITIEDPDKTKYIRCYSLRKKKSTTTDRTDQDICTTSSRSKIIKSTQEVSIKKRKP
jgi:hypothetical protein